MNKRKFISTILLCTFALICTGCQDKKIKITKAEIADKVRGGWAGQIIGCTYGGPTEFKYNLKTIPDNVEIKWSADKPLVGEKFGGLYDDVYLDATFMDVFEKKGLDANRADFLKAVGESEYPLWCANRAARFAWLDSFKIDAPTSWKNNIVSNDIDFQIEADFAGLMSPALPKAAAEYCDKVGRAINSGDGYYCGVYVATMYALAFVSNDIAWIVDEGLKSVPGESTTYKMARDIIAWHKENPKDWKYAWKKHLDKYTATHDQNQGGCFIYAPNNCAYILIGLLYGNGDFAKTAEISTRCGFDSDCNPASACGILATMTGYSKLDKKWTAPLEMCDDKLFSKTQYSPKKMYEVGFKQAMEVLKKYGAKIEGENVYIVYKSPKAVEFESPCPNAKIFKVAKTIPVKSMGDNAVLNFDFEGSGIVMSPTSEFNKNVKEFAKNGNSGIAMEIDVLLDGKVIRTVRLFADSYRCERDFFFAERAIADGKHNLQLRIKNIAKNFPNLEAKLDIYKRSK